MTINFFAEAVDHLKWVEKHATLGDLTIVLGKSKKALSDSAEFLPNKVIQGDKVLWEFDKRSYPDCLAFLREINGEDVIVYASRTQVVEIIPILDLLRARRLSGGQYDWSRPATERVALKIAAAEAMNREAKLNRMEQILKDRAEAEERVEATARLAEARQAVEAEKRIRLAQRQEYKRQIMVREYVIAYTACGEKRRGIPVVGDEWQSLGNGVDCISVDSYKDGVIGNCLEAFFVKVDGSRKSRQRSAVVTSENPMCSWSIERKAEILVNRAGREEVISCYTREGLDALQKEGLNGGAIRAMYPVNADGSVTLVSFSKGGYRTIDNVMPIAVT